MPVLSDIIQLCVYIHLLSEPRRSFKQNFWTVTAFNQCQFRTWSQRTEQEPTPTALAALKYHHIGNMTKTPQASLEFGVKQYMGNSAHHHSPHSLSTGYVNRASQLECKSHCNAWRSSLWLDTHSVFRPLKYCCRCYLWHFKQVCFRQNEWIRFIEG